MKLFFFFNLIEISTILFLLFSKLMIPLKIGERLTYWVVFVSSVFAFY